MFGRFAIGVRGIPSIAFAAVILAAGLYPSEPLPEMNRQHTVIEIDEAPPSPEPLDPATSYRDAANLSIPLELQFRRQRAKLRAQLTRSSGAFCVMSGASFDLPGGGSLLEVSHYHPLFQQGPDTINNLGLKTRDVHAIYENGLVTIRQDHRIRFAPDIPPGFRAEFRGRTHAAIPEIVNLSNLRFHEEEIFERRLRRLGISVSD